MKSLLILIVFINLLMGKEISFNEIEKILSKKGVSKEYLTQIKNHTNFNEIDLKTLKLLNPKEINSHRKNERKANKFKILNQLPETKAHLIKYKNVYDYVEKEYKTNREIIAAILLKETNIGKYELKHTAIIVFNSIIRKIEPTSTRNISLRKMASDSLIDLIYFSYKNKLNANEIFNIKSSYAGAIGYPQFMPFNLKLAKSFKNKKPDLSNMEDAIVSIANYMNQNMKWNELIDWNKYSDLEKINLAWENHIEKNEWIPLVSKKKKDFSSIYFKNKEEKEYFEKFASKIYKYNNSSEYVMGILLISQKLKFESKV